MPCSTELCQGKEQYIDIKVFKTKEAIHSPRLFEKLRGDGLVSLVLASSKLVLWAVSQTDHHTSTTRGRAVAARVAHIRAISENICRAQHIHPLKK